MELKNKVIHFLGDSITEGVGVSAADNIYLNLIKVRYGLKTANNYGIEGTRIAEYVGIDPKPYGNAFVERFKDMTDDADAVVVFGGTNDFGHGNAPIGTFGDDTPQTFYGALHLLMKGLIEKYPDKPIIFMTPLHRRNELDKSTLSGEVFRRYVDVIREMAEYFSIPVVDLYAGVGIQPNIPIQKELFCPDGLHPNDRGHEKIAAMLAAFLEQY